MANVLHETCSCDFGCDRGSSLGRAWLRGLSMVMSLRIERTQVISAAPKFPTLYNLVGDLNSRW
jgi:hypothetical protein